MIISLKHNFICPYTSYVFTSVEILFVTYRFVLGKNKVMQKGLGRTTDDEVYPNLHKISNRLIGERGLLFTDEPIEELLE